MYVSLVDGVVIKEIKKHLQIDRDEMANAVALYVCIYRAYGVVDQMSKNGRMNVVEIFNTARSYYCSVYHGASINCRSKPKDFSYMRKAIILHFFLPSLLLLFVYNSEKYFPFQYFFYVFAATIAHANQF